MFSFFQSKPRYSNLEDTDIEELKIGDPSSRRVTFQVSLCGILALGLLFFTSIGSTWILFFQYEVVWNRILALGPALAAVPTTLDIGSTSTPTSVSAWACVQPAVRREWRTLSELEQQDYIAAVQCLTTKPSKLRNNGTLYDDFPWIHKSTSTYSTSIDRSIMCLRKASGLTLLNSTQICSISPLAQVLYSFVRKGAERRLRIRSKPSVKPPSWFQPQDSHR